MCPRQPPPPRAQSPASNWTKSVCPTSPPAWKRASGLRRCMVELYLARIGAVDTSDAVDRNGPRLGAVLASIIPMQPLSRGLARSGTQKRPHSRPAAWHSDSGEGQYRNARSSLHHRRFARTGPLARCSGRIRRRTAARRGRDILGKTNLTEWANYRSTHSTSGWSGRGGQTKSPYALDRNRPDRVPVPAPAPPDLLPRPSAAKPMDRSPRLLRSTASRDQADVGLVSRSGIIPISISQDTAVPMGRTVRDVAILLSAVPGVDPPTPDTRHRKANSWPITRAFSTRTACAARGSASPGNFSRITRRSMHS